METRILELKKQLEKKIRDCPWHEGAGSGNCCSRIKCHEPNCKAFPWLHTITSHYYKRHPEITAKFRLESGFAPFAFTCLNCGKHFEEGTDKGPYHFYGNSGKLNPHEQFCEACASEFKRLREISQAKIMSKLKKTKRESSQKTTKKIVSAAKTKKTKSLTPLKKPRSPLSKENTLAYYDCLIGQVANPLNERVKITAMCHHCKHNKGKVAAVKSMDKQELVKQVAQNYLAFGKSLGSLLHENIVGCSCKE